MSIALSPTVKLVSPDLDNMPLSELGELAERLQLSMQEQSDVHFEVQEQRRYGPGTAWSDILHVLVPSADFIRDTAYGIIIAETLGVTVQVVAGIQAFPLVSSVRTSNGRRPCLAAVASSADTNCTVSSGTGRTAV
jgi:hypothetical protein